MKDLRGISKKDMVQSKEGLTNLRGMLADKRSELSKQMKSMKKMARKQEAPPWADEVMSEFNKGFNPENPFRVTNLLRILSKNKIL